MANNRLYIYNHERNEAIMLAKSFGDGWEIRANLDKSIDLIKEGGCKQITEVPVDLYYQVVQEMPACARIAINNGEENLIVYHGLHAITPKG